VIEQPAAIDRPRSRNRTGSGTMLAEIFLIHLQNLLRQAAGKESRTTSNDPRFVPIVLRA